MERPILKTFNGTTVYCFIASEGKGETTNKLFIGGIPSKVTEKELNIFFSEFGNVKDVRIVTDRITAECKGYGFVTFEDKSVSDRLIATKTVRMNGRKLRLRKAVQRSASQFDKVSEQLRVSKNNSIRPSSRRLQLFTDDSLQLVNDSSMLKANIPMIISSSAMFSPLTPPPSPARTQHSIISMHSIGQNTTDIFSSPTNCKYGCRMPLPEYFPISSRPFINVPQFIQPDYLQIYLNNNL
ncbi:protein boule-like isoform X1 [Hydra vulgaris]|uniref:protein boule-like isoform X1 n=1 Tax=Hydra vulgaris TaxID=6087 RepID=UPI001F5F5B0F|nr:protein boule-like [Hydra vulgaris]